MSTAGRAAIVTGGSSGIGLAIARMLAEEGHALTLVARDEARLAAAAGELEAAGAQVAHVAAQVGEAGAAETVLAAHEARWGRLDVLVNNAGVAMQAPLEKISDKRIGVQLDVNLWSVLRFYRAALPLLRSAAGDSGRALVINTASLTAKRPERLLSVYSASKAAVVAFTRAMNDEHAADGIRSCALCPGYVATPMVQTGEGIPDADELIRPEDVAELARALVRLSPACVVPEIELHRPGVAGL